MPRRQVNARMAVSDVQRIEALADASARDVRSVVIFALSSLATELGEDVDTAAEQVLDLLGERTRRTTLVDDEPTQQWNLTLNPPMVGLMASIQTSIQDATDIRLRPAHIMPAAVRMWLTSPDEDLLADLGSPYRNEEVPA